MINGFVEGACPSNRFTRRRKAGLLAVVVSALCCVIAALVVSGNDRSRLSNPGVNDTTRRARRGMADAIVVAATATAAQQVQRVEAEVITIRPIGFEPREITRPKGLFLLAVENRSGLQTVQLRLDREVGGPRLRDVQMPRNRHDWKDAFDLTPGRYVLTEAYHPEWICSITITSK